MFNYIIYPHRSKDFKLKHFASARSDLHTFSKAWCVWFSNKPVYLVFLLKLLLLCDEVSLLLFWNTFQKRKKKTINSRRVRHKNIRRGHLESNLTVTVCTRRRSTLHLKMYFQLICCCPHKQHASLRLRSPAPLWAWDLTPHIWAAFGDSKTELLLWTPWKKKNIAGHRKNGYQSMSVSVKGVLRRSFGVFDKFWPVLNKGIFSWTSLTWPMLLSAPHHHHHSLTWPFLLLFWMRMGDFYNTFN